jgi:hypothetical protein
VSVSDGMPTGERLYRIHWLPGTDTLRGTCHCGAERSGDDPVELWQWLLDHPRDHRGQPSAAPVHRSPTVRTSHRAPADSGAVDRAAVGV